MTGSNFTEARLGIGKDDASVTPVSSPHVPQYGLVYSVPHTGWDRPAASRNGCASKS